MEFTEQIENLNDLKLEYHQYEMVSQLMISNLTLIALLIFNRSQKKKKANIKYHEASCIFQFI